MGRFVEGANRDGRLRHVRRPAVRGVRAAAGLSRKATPHLALPRSSTRAPSWVLFGATFIVDVDHRRGESTQRVTRTLLPIDQAPRRAASPPLRCRDSASVNVTCCAKPLVERTIGP